MSVKVITKDNFENEVMHSEKPVLLDFWAAWCGPCKMLSPLVDKYSEEDSSVKVGKVNVDEENELASAFGISSIPALFVVKHNKVYGRPVVARFFLYRNWAMNIFCILSLGQK